MINFIQNQEHIWSTDVCIQPVVLVSGSEELCSSGRDNRICWSILVRHFLNLPRISSFYFQVVCRCESVWSCVCDSVSTRDQGEVIERN